MVHRLSYGGVLVFHCGMVVSTVTNKPILALDIILFTYILAIYTHVEATIITRYNKQGTIDTRNLMMAIQHIRCYDSPRNFA